MQQLQPRHMSSPPTTPKKRGKMAGGGGLARPAILSERIATGGHVPLDDSDVVVSSSRPPAEVILINAATANALAKVPHELPFSCDQDGTHSVSHEFTPSSIDNTSGGGGGVVVLLDPWRILVHKKVPPVESSPRRSRRRLVALSLLVLLLVGIAVGIALAYGGGGDGVHAMKGHDVVMWGDVPGTQDACCVIVDVARPGEDGGEEDEGSDGGGEDVPPIADASLAVLPPSNGGYDDHDPDPIVPASAPVATSGGGSTAKDPTASPTRGPTREESTSSGGGATASPTAVRRPAPSPSPDRGEDHASVARPSASPTTTSPTAGMPVAASSPSASPTANDTPTTTTYPTTEMPVTASPTMSSSASWAPVAVTAEPTPRSPSASPTDATWAPVALTAEPTTRSPSASPTDAPVTGSPTISPSETPTTFVAPEPTPYPMIIFSNCPDEATDDTKYQKGVMVSYRSDDPMWKVYECLVGACNAAGLSTERTWALRGLCKPSNDQIKGDSEDDAPEVCFPVLPST
ncbi:hypothetical protein ACHAW5_010249 [Stephanodiscus triporus]|uniref:Uncharacterized protein n=1 Tax=Stephanodiscus triporus TaxID=2934178 RepID=A0ABD3PG13_9STRA